MVQVDVRDFETLIARPDAASLERAVALYRDDFLAGFTVRGCPDFEDWQSSVADELRQSLARGLQRLVAACIADGELERATGHARRWLQLDPLHEPAHQAIIRLYGWAGQRSAAMRQYRALVRILDRDLAVRPLPETTRLYEDVRADRLGPAPARSAAVASGAAAGGLRPRPRPRPRLRPRPRPRRGRRRSRPGRWWGGPTSWLACARRGGRPAGRGGWWRSRVRSAAGRRG